MRLGILNVLSARRSLSLFLAGVVCLACWQIWLTWRVMEQDRNLELQRSRERLEQIADLAMAQLARNLGDWDLGLRELNSLPPSSSLAAKFPVRATLIVVTRDSVRTYPEIPLLFVPNAPRPCLTLLNSTRSTNWSFVSNNMIAPSPPSLP